MRARVSVGIGIWMVWALIALSTLSACVPYLDHTEPAIGLDPVTGGPGTLVAVSGSGFPAQLPVCVRLGPPSTGASPQSYGDAVTDDDGRFSLSLTMPVQWPDGTPIAETDLVVVVLNENGSTKATAPFRYLPPLPGVSALAPREPEARQPTLAWHREGDAAGFCGDVLVYEGGYVEITSCQESVPLARRWAPDEIVERLHTWTETYQSFEVEQAQGTGKDRVTTRITFVGRGSRQVSEIEMRMVQTFLETVVSTY
jgi:hypothetical protein